jgi:ABC-type amino acid transport system permease subunit
LPGDRAPENTDSNTDEAIYALQLELGNLLGDVSRWHPLHRYALAGLKWTLATAACAWIMALILGTIFGTLRTTTKPWVVRIANGYVELFRNIPLLVQMFLVLRDAGTAARRHR